MVPAPPAAAPTATRQPSRTSLCGSAAFNAARDSAALKRFVDSFPDDECGRHALAAKIATWEERRGWRHAPPARRWKSGRPMRGLFVGSTVAFRQEFPFCVSGTGASCQRVVYVFDVRPKCVTSMCKKAGRKYKSAKSRHWVMKRRTIATVCRRAKRGHGRFPHAHGGHGRVQNFAEVGLAGL